MTVDKWPNLGRNYLNTNLIYANIPHIFTKKACTTHIFLGPIVPQRALNSMSPTVVPSLVSWPDQMTTSSIPVNASEGFADGSATELSAVRGDIFIGTDDSSVGIEEPDFDITEASSPNRCFRRIFLGGDERSGASLPDLELFLPAWLLVREQLKLLNNFSTFNSLNVIK